MHLKGTFPEWLLHKYEDGVNLEMVLHDKCGDEIMCLISILCLFRYHAHQYTNGTICDLTNKPRETEV